MKRTETIEISFLTCSTAELKAAERKHVRLENAGYVLVSTTANRMTYRLED
jgi:hypothetical protein